MTVIVKNIGQHVKETVPIAVESLFLFSGRGSASIHLQGVMIATLTNVNPMFTSPVPGDYTIHIPNGTCKASQVSITPVFTGDDDNYVPFHPTQYRPNGGVPYEWGWVTAQRTVNTDLIITLTDLAGNTLDQTTNPIVSQGHWDT